MATDAPVRREGYEPLDEPRRIALPEPVPDVWIPVTAPPRREVQPTAPRRELVPA